MNREDEGYSVWHFTFLLTMKKYGLFSSFFFFSLFFWRPQSIRGNVCSFECWELAEGLLLCGSWLRNSACGMYFARWSCHLPPAVIPVTFGHNTTACQRP